MNKFRFWCQKVLPLVYDDSLSYYELLCKVVKYLNNVIELGNANSEAIIQLSKEVEELNTYVDNYFSNLDIQEEINNKLDEMATSGVLSDIIRNYLKLPSSNIYLEYVGMTPQDFSNTFPQRSLQGGCFVGNNFVCAYIENDTSNTLLVEYSNGNIVRTNNSLKLGHANGMTFDGSYLYVVGDVSPFQLDIFKISYETFNLVETIKLPGTEESYQYGDICYYKSKFYLINSAGNNSKVVITITSDFVTFETHVIEGFNWCSVFTIYNDNLLLFSVNNAVNSYSLIDFHENFSFTLNRNVNYNYVTEIEWCDVKNGEIYCSFNVNSPTKDGGWRQKAFITKFNPFRNNYTGKNVETPINVYVYVNDTYNLFDRDGTQNKPFATIEEALNCYYNTGINSLNIILKSLNDSYKDINVYNIKGVSINNESNKGGRIICNNAELSVANYKVIGIHETFPDFATGFGLTVYNNSKLFIHNGGTIEAIKIDTSSTAIISYTNISVNNMLDISGTCIMKSNSTISTVTDTSKWTGTRGAMLGNYNFSVVPIVNNNTIIVPMFTRNIMITCVLSGKTYTNIILPINTETGYITFPIGGNELALTLEHSNAYCKIKFNAQITNARFC